MKAPALPDNEELRLEALRSLRILDSLPEQTFDDITATAAAICGMPMCLISLVDRERQWFKSSVGIEVSELPRVTSFCGHTIHEPNLMEVRDTHLDDRFHDNPLVLGDPRLRFYAGAPLTTESGLALGALCVLDLEPRELDDDQREALRRLARVAVQQMTLRRQALDGAAEAAFLKAMMSSAGVGITALDESGIVTHVNPTALSLFGIREPEQAVGRHRTDIATFLPEDGSSDRERQALGDAALFGPGQRELTLKVRGRDGRLTPARVTTSPIETESGERLGHLLIAESLSAVREAESQLSLAMQIVQRQADLRHDLHQAQQSFLAEPDKLNAFDQLLDVLLEYSESEYGFIGEVLRTVDGDPYLKTHAITNIAWTDDLKAFFDENAPNGLEFYNLDTLFGQVMVTGQPVIANDPANDPRAGGLPEGHPDMRCFLGLPIRSGDTVVGMVGVANRPNGYDEELVEDLDPLVSTYGNLITARNDRLERLASEESLRRSEAHLQRVIDASGLGDWEIDPELGQARGNWARVLGYPSDHALDHWAALVHEDDVDVVEGVMDDEGDEERTVDADCRMKASDGTWRWVRVSRSRERTEGVDGPNVIVGTLQDIHDKKTIEEQSLQLHRNRVLLQEVHHRVKNNLQIVSSLLMLQENASESPGVARQLAESRDRVAAIGQVHELLYRSEQLDTLDFGQLVEELSMRVVSALRSSGLTIHLDVDTTRVDIDAHRAGSLALILNELLSNAAKHAFEGRSTGSLSVRCQLDEGGAQVVLEVRDDGVGMDPDAVEKAEARGSIGLQIIRRLSAQARVTLEWETGADGTTCRLLFPVST